MLAKRAAIQTCRRTILWVGRTTEGLFHLTGEDELADRIRTSTRRPVRASEEAKEADTKEADTKEADTKEAVAKESGSAAEPDAALEAASAVTTDPS